MELGSRRLAALFLHTVAAEMNSECNIRKSSAHILWSNPIFRIFRMIVVAVHAKAVRSHKVGIGAIAVPICDANVVMAYSLTKGGSICYDGFMRIAAVARSACTVSKINSEFCHQETSSQSAVKYRTGRCFSSAFRISAIIPLEICSPNTHTSAHLLISAMFMNIDSS